MFTLFDLMRAAQGGAALTNMARQFGLSVEQTQRAMEAVMPAFAMAFQRNASDPMGFSNLMRMMTSGQYAGFFDNPGLAFSPSAMSQGSEIVRQLFGPEVSRHVEQQAAAWAGIAPEIMKQMLPVTAAMLMGGLFRSAATEGLADYFEKLADTLRGERRPAPERSRDQASDAAAMPNPLSLWWTMMETMTRGGRAESKETSKAADQPGDVFSAWADMMGAMFAAGQPAPARPPEPPQPEPSSPEPPSSANPFAFVGRLFETGIEAQQQHLATLQTIFDTYWGPRDKQR